MPIQTNDPRSRFSLLLAEASGNATLSAQNPELAGLADEVIMLANHKCHLLPHIRGTTIQPIEEWAATSDILQLSEWAVQFPGCGWELFTGQRSGVIVLEAESEVQLAAIRDLNRDEDAETLYARFGSRTLAFYRYPNEAHVTKVGRISLTPGLAVLTDGCRVLLPSGADAWPYPNASILPAPAWLFHCAFGPFIEADSALPAIPPRLEIVGGPAWRRNGARR